MISPPRDGSDAAADIEVIAGIVVPFGNQGALMPRPRSEMPTDQGSFAAAGRAGALRRSSRWPPPRQSLRSPPASNRRAPPSATCPPPLAIALMLCWKRRCFRRPQRPGGRSRTGPGSTRSCAATSTSPASFCGWSTRPGIPTAMASVSSTCCSANGKGVGARPVDAPGASRRRGGAG